MCPALARQHWLLPCPLLPPPLLPAGWKPVFFESLCTCPPSVYVPPPAAPSPPCCWGFLSHHPSLLPDGVPRKPTVHPTPTVALVHYRWGLRVPFPPCPCCTLLCSRCVFPTAHRPTTWREAPPLLSRSAADNGMNPVPIAAHPVYLLYLIESMMMTVCHASGDLE